MENKTKETLIKYLDICSLTKNQKEDIIYFINNSLLNEKLNTKKLIKTGQYI